MDRRRFLALGLAASSAPFLLRSTASATPARPRRRVPAATGYIATRWDTDPWSRGSYSALPVGTSPAARATLAQAIIGGRIVLAGEYASPQYPATTTGAYLSGRHAAGRLLDRAQPRSVVIIGAGLAGAAAAARMRGAGVRVTVVEARDRIGGRIDTNRQWAAPVELGAAWIHGTGGNPLVPLARADGLRLVPTDYDDAVARDTVTGRVSAQAESRWDRLDVLLEQLGNSWPAPTQSVEGWLRQRGWTDGRIDSWAAQVEITQEYGLDPNQLGVRATQEGATYRGGDVLVADGYDTIPRTLLEGIDVQLSSPVEQVTLEGRQVSVALASGRRLRADAVIVAVPLSLLRAGSPRISPMRADVRDAARSITTGVFEKIVLRYDEQWWGDQQVYGVVGGGAPGAPEGSLAALRWTEFYSLTNVVGFPVLVGFSGGRAAQARPDTAQGCAAEATACLSAAFGAVGG